MIVLNNNVYFTNAAGSILEYNPKNSKLQVYAKEALRKDYFGKYDETQPGSMAYHWRSVALHKNTIYGVHGNSGYLFKLDLESKFVEIIRRISSKAS